MRKRASALTFHARRLARAICLDRAGGRYFGRLLLPGLIVLPAILPPAARAVADQ
jgi:hypothetical protein